MSAPVRIESGSSNPIPSSSSPFSEPWDEFRAHPAHTMTRLDISTFKQVKVEDVVSILQRQYKSLCLVVFNEAGTGLHDVESHLKKLHVRMYKSTNPHFRRLYFVPHYTDSSLGPDALSNVPSLASRSYSLRHWPLLTTHDALGSTPYVLAPFHTLLEIDVSHVEDIDVPDLCLLLDQQYASIQKLSMHARIVQGMVDYLKEKGIFAHRRNVDHELYFHDYLLPNNTSRSIYQQHGTVYLEDNALPMMAWPGLHQKNELEEYETRVLPCPTDEIIFVGSISSEHMQRLFRLLYRNRLHVTRVIFSNRTDVGMLERLLNHAHIAFQAEYRYNRPTFNFYSARFELPDHIFVIPFYLWEPGLDLFFIKERVQVAESTPGWKTQIERIPEPDPSHEYMKMVFMEQVMKQLFERIHPPGNAQKMAYADFGDTRGFEFHDHHFILFYMYYQRTLLYYRVPRHVFPPMLEWLNKQHVYFTTDGISTFYFK